MISRRLKLHVLPVGYKVTAMIYDYNLMTQSRLQNIVMHINFSHS